MNLSLRENLQEPPIFHGENNNGFPGNALQPIEGRFSQGHLHKSHIKII
jgi:hypothetical protein